ncbi:MAG: MarR family winged helix-turn-helix transcriptional regulator [Dermatophilaceae bacterium]
MSHSRTATKMAALPSTDSHPDNGAAPALGRPTLPLETGLGFRLARLARTLRSQWAGVLEPLELTTAQAVVLRAVATQPGRSLRSLARTLATDPMNAKRCVDHLEQRGLLRSEHRGEDRRSRALRLTDSGQLLAARVDALALEQEQRLEQWLGAEHRSRLATTLGRLEARLDLTTPTAPGDPR